MEGKKAREKDGKVRGGFAWALVGAGGKELLTHGGSRNLRACRKIPGGCSQLRQWKDMWWPCGYQKHLS